MSEVSKSKEEESPTVTLSLGQLALSAEQLVLLREGDTIQLPCTFPLAGALTLDNKAWAYVSIDKGSLGLEITVKELVTPL